MKTILPVAILFAFSTACIGQGFEWATHLKALDIDAVLSNVRDIETDGNGNVYIAGTFNGTVDFGGGPVTATGPVPGITIPDGFIAKYSPTGAFIQVETFPSSNGGTIEDIELDEEGNIYLIATILGETTFAGTAVGSPSDPGLVIAMLNSSLELVWIHSHIQPSNLDIIGGHALTLGPANDLYISGVFENDLALGAFMLNESSDKTRYFLARIRRDGTVLWLNACGNYFPNSPGSDVATDNQSNVYLTSSTIDPSDFGGIALDASAGRTYFLVKFDSLGTAKWLRSATSSGSLTDRGDGVAIDPNTQAIYVTGTFSSEVFELGNVTLSPADFCCDDFFIAKYNTDGDILWAKQSHGPAPSTRGLGIDISADGGAIVTGIYGRPMDGGAQSLDVNFGEGPNQVFLKNEGSWDVFIAKYLPNGNLGWAKRAYGTEADFATCIAAVGADGAVFAGTFNEYFVLGGDTLNAVPNPGTDNMYLAKCGNTAVPVKDVAPELTLSASPNPAKDVLTVEIKGGIPPEATLQILDALGREWRVYSGLQNRMDLSLSGLAAGNYFLRLHTSHAAKTIQFFLTHP